MDKKSSFKRKFNIGLTLATTLHEYIDFLNKYKEYIYSVYFSLPLGEKFHTRKIISQQFETYKNRELFWDLLKLSVENDIRIELVLNTYSLTSDDIYLAKNTLIQHNIKVDSISILDNYYAQVSSLFPNTPLVYSFNNTANLKDIKEIDKLKDRYAVCVFGRSYLRNNEVFEKYRKTNLRVSVLLNNGCSFNCKTCYKAKDCFSTFSQNLQIHEIEYLYALQSIMPFELYDGTLDMSVIDILKVSNRSSSLMYLKRCLDSYLNNSTVSYLNENTQNYHLWCRLRHFSDYYNHMSLDKIIMYKEKLLGHKVQVT